MTYVNISTSVNTNVSGRFFRLLLRAAQRALSFTFAAAAEHDERRKSDHALRQLRTLRDYDLYDVGLCRADLTPEGLAAAAERRSAYQIERAEG